VCFYFRLGCKEHGLRCRVEKCPGVVCEGVDCLDFAELSGVPNSGHGELYR
jgi:hypothetical protein